MTSDILRSNLPADSVDATRSKGPHNHRTVDRVTQIVEEVVYKPGMSLAQLAQALGAPKSSVYGFVRGLQAQGWLYERDRRFYLGPAVYGLTLASGHIRAGLVTHESIAQLHHEAGTPVFLAVPAGDHVISIDEAGSDAIGDFEARTNIRRTFLVTAAGKALLAARSPVEIHAYLRSRSAAEHDLVTAFLNEYDEILRTGIATNLRRSGSRFALATCVRSKAGEAVAAVTLVGRTQDLKPREAELSQLLLRHVRSWSRASIAPREPI